MKNLLTTRELQKVKKEIVTKLAATFHAAGGLPQKKALALAHKIKFMSTPKTLTMDFSKILQRGENLTIYKEELKEEINAVRIDVYERLQRSGISKTESRDVAANFGLRINPKSITINVAKVKMPKP